MRDSRSRRVAVIDLGSNTARLVVMRAIQGHSYRLEDEIREVVRLRAGMTGAGLSEEAIARALFTLRLFKQFCESIGVDTILPTATSAVREAANGPHFVKRVRRDIGLKLQVLSGEREAYYGTIGALNEVPLEQGYVVDIGGGSAQISQVRKRRFRQGGSLPLGALALTEQFIHHDPVKRGEFEAVREEIERRLDTLAWPQPGRKQQLVGLGGTIRNLARIEANRRNYPLYTLHGFTLSRDSVAASIEAFRELPLARRANVPGLNSDRADIILPGAMVILAIMDRLGTKDLTISVNGLREGIFFAQFFWRNQPTPIIDDVRRFGVLNLARAYAFHQQHAVHVRHLASRLFEQLAPLHGYGLAELELLQAASLLHDLGTAINYEDHHKHSQMLIVNNGLPGYTPRETALISLLARYHRKGNPAVDAFASILDDGDDVRLIRLAALLRLAEFLERGRDGAVRDVTVSWDNCTLLVTLAADTYPAVELWDAERNAAPLVERAFDRTVRIECPDAPVRWE